LAASYRRCSAPARPTTPGAARAASRQPIARSRSALVLLLLALHPAVAVGSPTAPAPPATSSPLLVPGPTPDRPPEAVPDPPARPPPPAEPRRWYGWQSLLVFAGSAALMATGSGLVVARKTGVGVALLVTGIGAQVFGPLFVHEAHDQRSSAIIGTNAQVFFPLLGLIGAAAIMPRCARGDDACTARAGTGYLVGAIVGSLAASTLDVAVLSYEPLPGGSSSVGRRWWAAPSAGPSGLGVSVGGSW
jgi:hypothetical protein